MNNSYQLSRYVVARKPYRCLDCGGVISPGARYLSFRAGLMSSQHICGKCSVRVSERGTPYYYCKAVEDELSSVLPTP